MNQLIDNLLVDIRFNIVTLLIIDFYAAWLSYRVYKSDPKMKANRLFVLMTTMFLFWINAGYWFAFSENLDLSLWLGRIILGEVIWSFILLYFFLIHFPVEEKASPLLNKIVIGVGVIFSLASVFSGFIVKSVRLTKWGIDPVFATYGKFIYYAIIAALMALAVIQMSKKYPRLTTDQKKKVQLFFIGVSFFVIMNFLFNVFLPLLRDSIKYWQLGNYAAAIFLALTAYAMFRHELFSVKIIATEALTILIWTILLSKLFVTQSLGETLVDVFVLVLAIVFGILLIRSVIREVEQRKQLEVLNEKLKELDKQKDEFISLASHELRAPLTAIKGYVSMIIDGDFGTIPGGALDSLKDISSVTDRLVRLVNNMLNVSRIEKGKITYQMGTTRLTEVANLVFKEFKITAEAKGLQIYLQIPPGIRDVIFVDLDRIHEVATNLVSNATKYTEKGSVTIKLSNPDTNWVRMEIIDTGSGISKEEQQRLFEKFVRVESKVGKTVGSGLGLYISKLLVHKFGGRLGLVSEPGKGSNFWFELPVNKNYNENNAKQSEPVPATTNSTNNPAFLHTTRVPAGTAGAKAKDDFNS